MLLAGCTPPVRQFDLVDQPLTCDAGNRLAYRTIEAMRYSVDSFQPAAPGGHGVIKATRVVSKDTGETKHVTIAIDCGPGGVSFDASEDGRWFDQMEFKRAFHHAFLNVRSMGAAQAELDAEMVAGTAPTSQQRRDLKVIVQPLHGQASKLDFPFDLEAAGILPVRVDVTNLTARTYTLAPDEMRLARADRERVAALAPADAAARVAAARQPDGGKPLTTLSSAAITDILTLHLFTATDLPPSAQRSGYLYFPLAQYTGARLVFTDRETGEDEGVRVEF
jgi:hypothetical protein